MELINTFGLDIKILLAQLITFLVFFFVLYKYALGPISTFLEKRRESIRKSLEEAEIAKNSVSKAEETREKILEEAKVQAKDIIAQAEQQANLTKEQIINKAKKEATEISKRTEEKLKNQKKSIIRNAKNNIASIALTMAEKILGQKIQASVNDEYIKESIQKITSDNEAN